MSVFVQNRKKMEMEIFAFCYIWGHNFLTNQDLEPLSASKWLYEPQFSDRWKHMATKIARSGGKTVIYKGTFISNQSLLHKTHYLYF